MVKTRWLHRTLYILAFILLSVTAGCGKRIRVVPVSGRVTQGGQPLAGVAVNFAPETGGLDTAYAAYGKTDRDGRFTLKLVDNEQAGAMPGPHRVMLHESGGATETDGAAPAAPLKLPSKARDGTLTYTVPDNGTDAANFKF